MTTLGLKKVTQNLETTKSYKKAYLGCFAQMVRQNDHVD